MSTPNRAYVSVASNIEPEKNVLAALEALADQVRVDAVSTFYVTAALGRPEQADYLNGVARVETSYTPRGLRQTLREIEAGLGRVRTADKYAARPIDLDILLFGTLVVREDDLTIPDPDLRSRAFLTACVLELDRDLVLPDTGAPLEQAINADEVRKLEPARTFTALLKERLGV